MSTTFPALKEAQEKLAAKRKALADIFAEAGPNYDMDKVKSLSGDSHDKVEAIRALNAEVDDLGRQVDGLQDVLKAAQAVEQHKGAKGVEGGAGHGPVTGFAEVKDVGQLFVESEAFRLKSGSAGPESTLDIELKTLFQTTAGWAPESTRTGTVIESAQRPVQVTDIVPQTTTSQAAVTYMEETTFTNAAAEAAEGAAYAEAALALTERSNTVRKIAVFLPVTDEQLEDEPQARGYVNNRLPFMLRQRLDSQILVGTGVAPNLTGILNVAGIQNQAKGTDPVPDAVYKALTKVRVTGRALPNAAIFHPNDWQDIRLLRTADGIYIWGNPSDAGPERIWGLRVVQSDALTENTGLVGDFANFSELAVRRGIDVQVSNSHSTYFVEGKQALRADVRCALVIYRPAAFATVTGI